MSTYSSAVLADNPSVYYRLGDASGTVMTDSGPVNAPGTYVGSPTLGVTGALVGDPNTAMTLNGSSQYGKVTAVQGGQDIFNNAVALSIECWVKYTTGQITVIAGLGNPIDGTAICISLGSLSQPSGSPTLIFQVADDTGTELSADQDNNDGAWHHVVGTWTTTIAHMYVDGVLQNNSTPVTGSIQNTLFQLFAVGASVTTIAASDEFAGSVDEVAIYTTALSSARVLYHYQAGKGTLPGSTKVNAARNFFSRYAE